MNSLVYRGETTHRRARPREHSFRYRIFWLCLDLDELAELDRTVARFGYNRRSICSIRDADYGGPGPGRIRDKIVAKLRDAGLEAPIERIALLTVPRVLGYVFNPVSFYLCYGPDDTIVAFVAEVRNTFGESHHYVVPPVDQDDDAAATSLRFRMDKVFYVSPFLEVSGEYDVRLNDRADGFALGVTLRQDGDLVFAAGMNGRGAPLTSRGLLAALARFPLYAATVIPRIHWQAFQLRFRRRVPVQAKPAPVHPSTIAPARPSFWPRLRASVVNRAHRRQQQSTGPVGPVSSGGES